MCGALLSPHGFKNDFYFIVVRLCRPWLKERRIFHVKRLRRSLSHEARQKLHMEYTSFFNPWATQARHNEIYVVLKAMRRKKRATHEKNRFTRECYTCNALVSPHGFKNDVYFIVARLFRLMA